MTIIDTLFRCIIFFFIRQIFSIVKVNFGLIRVRLEEDVWTIYLSYRNVAEKKKKFIFLESADVDNENRVHFQPKQIFHDKHNPKRGVSVGARRQRIVYLFFNEHTEPRFSFFVFVFQAKS